MPYCRCWAVVRTRIDNRSRQRVGGRVNQVDRASKGVISCTLHRRVGRGRCDCLVPREDPIGLATVWPQSNAISDAASSRACSAESRTSPRGIQAIVASVQAWL